MTCSWFSGKERFLLYSNPYDEVTRRIAFELAERTG